MSFLNPSLLAWLAPLLALPLIIHALNKKFPRLFEFSTVRHLQLTVARQSKLFRMRHWILLLLRTVCLTLLLIVFLKPVLPKLGSNLAQGHGRRVLILVDHSLSMEYKGESLSPRKRAVIEAEKILDNLGPEDAVNVILVENAPASCFLDFTNSRGEARRFLDQLKPGLGRADFNQANTAAARLLSRASSPSEIYYISDFQRKNWANVDFSRLPEKTRLFFVDVSTQTHENRAILGASVDPSQILAGQTVLLEVNVGNYGSRPMNDRLKVIVDNQASFEKEVSVPPWSTAKTTLPIVLGRAGMHQCEISLPDDDLPQDNHYFLSLQVLDKEEVLVVSDDPDTLKSGAYFLQTALNPYENLQGALLPRLIRSDELSSAALAGVKKLFLTSVGRMNEASCTALAKFVFQGGGAVCFLDGKSDRENLLDLEKVIGAGAMPMKLGERRTSENIATGAQQINKGDFKSRYLKLFRGDSRQNLALLEFYDSYRAASTGNGNVLLSYGDDSPAMAILNYGTGTMLLMNFSVSEFSSNLARQRIFPAWIQEIVKNLGSDDSAAPAYFVGEVVNTEVWRADLKGAEFKGPAGAFVSTKREWMGDRCAVAFTPDQPGFYTLGGPNPRYAFGVNTSPDESDLRKIDRDALPDALKAGQQGHFVEGERDYENLIQGKPIFQYFVAGALAVLLLEMAFQWLVSGNRGARPEEQKQ